MTAASSGKTSDFAKAGLPQAQDTSKNLFGAKQDQAASPFGAPAADATKPAAGNLFNALKPSDGAKTPVPADSSASSFLKPAQPTQKNDSADQSSPFAFGQ